MSNLDELFSEAASERIRKAVAEAEGRTSGEIVPYVVAASDTYAGSYWLSSLLGALAGPIAAWAVWERWELWGLPALVWLVGPALVGALAGWLAAFAVPAWRRGLAGEETLERRTRRRAAVAFLEEEIFQTRDRTGILIFLSLFEHRVVVLGDEGINRRVGEGEWDAVVAGVVEGIRAGRPADALVEAIGRCGELLETRGVDLKLDDTDELSDELRRRDR